MVLSSPSCVTLFRAAELDELFGCSCQWEGECVQCLIGLEVRRRAGDVGREGRHICRGLVCKFLPIGGLT